MKNAEAIIHAVGPDFGRTPKAFRELEESSKQCFRAYKKFTADYPDYDIDVKLCAFSAKEKSEVQSEYKNHF